MLSGLVVVADGSRSCYFCCCCLVCYRVVVVVVVWHCFILQQNHQKNVTGMWVLNSSGVGSKTS